MTLKTKHLYRSLISLILIFAMSVYIWPMAAYAELSGAQSGLSGTETDVSEAQMKDFLSGLFSGKGEKGKRILSESELSPYVDYETAYAAGHVERLTDAETLNTIAYLNKNGTKTVYFFDDNIKFVDENGKITDKNINLRVTADGYATRQNDVGLTLPSSISDGITVSYNGNTLRLIPVPGDSMHMTANARVNLKSDDNALEYNSVFDDDSDVIYIPTLNGVKEEIVLSRYNGTTSWTFVAETNGMYPYCGEDGIYYFAESEDAKEKFSLGQVFAYDSACNIDGGTMQITEIRSGEYYAVTMSVNEEFLTDAKTVYPVHIDPQVEINNASVTTNIQDTTIYSGKPTLNTGTWAFNHAGLYSSAYGVGRILVKLPGLTGSADYISSSASDILNATFYICEGTGSGGQTFSIHAFTGNAWTETGATWNNVGADNYVSTAVATAKPGARAYGAFDITSLVREWKNGTKNADRGFLFKNTNETDGNVCRSFLGNNYATVSQRPKLSVTYRDKTITAVSGDMGISDTYTYDTSSLDNNVTNRVSHAWGNLVSSTALDAKLKNFPISLEYIYNSKLYKDSASSGDFYQYYGISTSYKMGRGWKLSLVELMKYDSSNDIYLYVDNYGTEYSFIPDATSGLYTNAVIGASLDIDTANNTVTLVNGDITRVFNSNGLLTSLECDDKTYTYNYTGTYALSSVTSAGETVISFTYTSNNLTGIGDYTITYDSSANVTKISDSYANVHEYQTMASMFAVRRSIDGYAYTYTFDSNKRINNIKYCRYVNSVYNAVEETKIYYGTRYTVYQNPGKDYDFSATADNIYTTVVFSKDGRTLHSVVKNGSEIYNAIMYGLTENEGGNKTASSVSGGGSENYLDNSSFEATSGVTNVTRSIEEALLGSYSAKFASAANSYFSINLAPGTYTFSVYVKLKGVAKNTGSAVGGAYAEVKDASGAAVSHSGYYVGTNNENIGNGWYRIFATFTVTSAQTYTLNFGLRNAAGTVYADCAQLEKNSVPTAYNALPFTGAEQTSNPWSSATDATIASGNSANGTKSWQVSTGKTVYREIPVNASVTTGFTVSAWAKASAVTNAAYGADITLRYSDGTEETVKIRYDGSYADWQYQCYEITSSKTDKSLKIASVKLSLVNSTSGLAYFDDVVLSPVSGNAYESDESDTDDTAYSTGLAFKSNGDGTCFVGTIGTCTDTVINIPPKSPAGDTVTSIGNSAFKNNTSITKVILPDTVKSISDNAFWGCQALESINIPDGVTQIRSCTFHDCKKLKDIRLPDGVTTIGYKAFSYCSSLKALNLPKSVTTFGDYAFYQTTSGFNLYYEGTSTEYAAITKGTGAAPSTMTVNFNSQIYNDIAYIYTYDANDNITSTKIKYVGTDSTLANGTDILFTSSTYDANGNCLTYTDEAGNTTTYTYDSHGNVLTIKDANNVTTTYTYNANGLAATMARGTAKNTYTYTNGLLTKIVHSDTATGKSETYNIVYNVYGNITSISVGSQTLISYEYAGNGAGNLTKTTYGSGAYEAYVYDIWGNAVEQYSGTTLKYEYAYDVNGTVITAVDHESGRTKKLIYAADNRLVGTATIDNATNGVLVLAEDEIYKFSDNMTSEFTGEYDYVYDALGRTKTSSLKNGTTNVITKTFTYLNKTNSTNLVASEQFSNGATYSYEYDALNRLTSVKENGTIKLKYTYDSMGRLTREDNAYANKTYVYEYITNGNIASKKTYAYTTGTLGTVQTTETRAYGNSNWLDQLTNINATAITYDSMGNPLNWHNASAFTWEGRKLKSLTKTDGTVISYAYDENGIRTGKTAGSENVSYVLDGTKIVREIRSAYTLTFLYDDSGVLIGFNYNNGTTSADYYYGIDNWGNINYIYDSTGAVVVTYKYDAWGNAISTTGTLAGTIGAINPYRYKSYYYDTETGLYYLQSRYYDAQVQRFVSPDNMSMIYTLYGNFYVYCNNNPINLHDSDGNIPKIVVVGGIAVAAGAVASVFALSIEMYMYALTGARIKDNIDISPWWNSMGGLMKNRLRFSNEVTKRIKLYINQIKQNSYSRREAIYFNPANFNLADMDLGLSVGNAENFTMTVTKTGRKKWFSSKYAYKVKIELSDRYDFEMFNKDERGLILTIINNYLGYYPMNWGLLKPYTWKICFEFTYYY